MTERTLDELANAEIVPDMGGPNAYFVRFSEGDYDTVNKSAKNTLLLKHDLLGGSGGIRTIDGVTVDFNLGESSDEITMARGTEDVRVPADRHEHVMWAVHDEDGDRLNDLFDELYTPTVRQGLMDMLMPRFRDSSTDIQKTDDGWLLNGDILVSWDASNHPVNVAQTHVVSGGSTVEADEDKEARGIEFNLPDERTVALPNSTRTTLENVEMEFLTSVALILDATQTGLYDDCLTDAIRDSYISTFTDTKSGLHHGHGLDKHTLDDLGVTDEAIDRLWYNEYDHTGVHEMKVRRDEFENAPIDVFENAPNDDTRKWQKIENTSEQAPIPKHVRADLSERYE